MALRRKFGGGCGDVRNLELEAGLGDWDLGWPFRGAETGIGCFWKGPQPEVLRPFKLLGEHVVTLFAFKGQAQAVLVERSSCFSVPHDGSEAGHELDVHGVHLRSVSIAHWKFLSPVPGQDSLPLVPIPAVYLSTRLLVLFCSRRFASAAPNAQHSPSHISMVLRSWQDTPLGIR